jgi:LPXTG-motif cell wall-anchored protein
MSIPCQLYSKSNKVPLFKKVILIFVALLILLSLARSLALAQGNVLTDPPQTYELTRGWYEGRQTYYYDFGTNSQVGADDQTVVPAPIYVLVTGFNADGSPQVVEGQRNIIDVIPGDEGYSDLWEVTFVTVPEDYVANTITSAEEIISGGYEQTKAGFYVNCPVVPADSTLAEDGGTLTLGWYKGQDVSYFDFGMNPLDAAPIYVFITGFDGDDNPQFVEDQQNVIGVIPGDAGYSAFWQVNLVTVPAGYVANTITSVDQVLSSGYEIVTSDMVVNCPVLRTDAAAPASPTTLPQTGSQGMALSWLALAAGVAVLVSGWFLRTRAERL